MTHLINKSALIAEIEKKINSINLDTIEDWRYRLQWEHDIEVMKNVISLIDTLEVKEPASEDLEQVAQEYTEKGSKCQEEMDAFIAGAQWQRDKMIKDAVIIEDELVMCYNNGKPTGLSPYKEWWETPEIQNKYKDGDKVKVIIIKDEI